MIDMYISENTCLLGYLQMALDATHPQFKKEQTKEVVKHLALLTENVLHSEKNYQELQLKNSTARSIIQEILLDVLEPNEDSRIITKLKEAIDTLDGSVTE